MVPTVPATREAVGKELAISGTRRREEWFAIARTSLEEDELWQRFHHMVNMTSEELATWLGTEPDLDAPEPGNPAPAPLGEAVVGVLRKRRADLTNDDLTTMEQVVEIVEHETGGLTKDDLVNDERKRHRLMTIGHDPLRER